MSFKYINPGYGSLLATNDGATTAEDRTYNPTNGVSFKRVFQSNDSYAKMNLPEGITSDLYCKFNLYKTSSGNVLNHWFGDYANGTSGNKSWINGLQLYQNSAFIYSNCGRRGSGQSLTTGLNTIWFHIHYGSSAAESYGELKVNSNDLSVISFESNYGYSASSLFNSANKEFIIYFPATGSYGDYIWLSNLIISDEEINPKEQIIRLTAGTTEGTMTYDSGTGIYTASEVNQNVLQSVNVNSLIDTYGSDSKVTGIALIGNPAYKTGEEFSNLTSLQKVSGTTTEKETISLGTDSDSAIVSAWQMSTDTTIADIGNMRFGWKAGA